MRVECRIIGFAVAHDTAIGRQLDEQEIAASGLRRRVGDHKGPDIGDFHRQLRDMHLKLAALDQDSAMKSSPLSAHLLWTNHGFAQPESNHWGKHRASLA